MALSAKSARNRRLTFLAEWFHEDAGIVRKFTISFYSVDNAIEVLADNKKVFLRRTKMPNLSESEFFIGSKINVFGREFDLVDYGDEKTKQILLEHRKSVFIIINHSLMPRLGEILTTFINGNFFVNKAMMASFSIQQLEQFFGDRNKSNLNASTMRTLLITGNCVGLELVGDNALAKLVYCYQQSTEDVGERFFVPPDLYALFSHEPMRTGIYCAHTADDVEKDVRHFFDPVNGLLVDVHLKNTTLCIVKPHSIKEGNLGHIINDIVSNGFKITAVATRIIDRTNCEEFYEIYHGVVPEYIAMVSQLTSGMCFAMEIASTNESKNTYEEFRKFCGPADPDMAKLLRPQTLRANYGHTRPLNAVHCTDIPDDTVREVEYMFKILK